MKISVKHYVRTRDGQWQENARRLSGDFDLDPATVAFLQQWQQGLTPWQLNQTRTAHGRYRLASLS